MTIIEAIVSASILVMLTSTISIFIIHSFSSNKYAFEQGINTALLERALRSFATNLREAKQGDNGAYLLESGDDFDLVFYANLDDDTLTERAHYFLEDGELKLGITEPTGSPATYPSGDQTVESLGSGIVNTAEQKLFYYYDRDYPLDTNNNPMSTPIVPSEVGLVKISVYSNINPEQAPDNMQMETIVRPRNITHQAN